MKVKALQQGYYKNQRRREGDVFEVPEGTKSKWFVPLDAAPEKAEPEAEPDTLSGIGKEIAKRDKKKAAAKLAAVQGES